MKREPDQNEHVWDYRRHSPKVLAMVQETYDEIGDAYMEQHPDNRPEEAVEPDKLAPFFTVAVYLVGRAYGGPEEGGWWYDHGKRQDVDFSKEWPEFGRYGIPRIFGDEESAFAWGENVNALLDETINKGRREIGSVLSTGRYHAEVHEGYPVAHWPETQPYYE